MLLWCSLFFSSLMLVAVKGYHEPCSKYGCPLAPTIHDPFVPAPPGHTPRCAKPGLTFCESLERYPQQLIKFLIDKRNVDFEKFLRDESPEDFDANSNKPNYEYGYDYPKPKVPPELYPQTSRLLPHGQPPTLHYNVPLNVTHNRYLPATQNLNPFLQQSAVLNPQAAFGYPPAGQLRPQFQTAEIFDPNHMPWPNRNSRGVVGQYQQQQQAGRTRYQNPLLEFATRPRNRAKRQQSDASAFDLCPTRAQFVVPKAALNNEGNWMFVVNLEDTSKYSQLLKIEVCSRTACDGVCSLPLGYMSKCKQRYVQKRLVALEGSGNRLYTDVFWFPHGCSCQITPDY